MNYISDHRINYIITILKRFYTTMKLHKDICPFRHSLSKRLTFAKICEFDRDLLRFIRKYCDLAIEGTKLKIWYYLVDKSINE